MLLVSAPTAWVRAFEGVLLAGEEPMLLTRLLGLFINKYLITLAVIKQGE